MSSFSEDRERPLKGQVVPGLGNRMNSGREYAFAAFFVPAGAEPAFRYGLPNDETVVFIVALKHDRYGWAIGGKNDFKRPLGGKGIV